MILLFLHFNSLINGLHQLLYVRKVHIININQNLIKILHKMLLILKI